MVARIPLIHTCSDGHSGRGHRHRTRRAPEAPIIPHPRRAGLLLPLLAPYLAVILGWVILHDAWLALLAYHGQILLWYRLRPAPPSIRFRANRLLWFSSVTALAGPALYILLPQITRVELAPWLDAHGLDGWSLVLMVPYYGIVHPVLEQLHWSTLRRRTPFAHPLFAGYHVLVLFSLLPIPWLAVCFLTLLAVSRIWQEMELRSEGLVSPILSHTLADLGIVLVALLRHGSGG